MHIANCFVLVATQFIDSRTSVVWQTFEVLPVKHSVCQFGHYVYPSICLTNFFAYDNFQKHLQAKFACQPIIAVVA